MKPEKTLRNAQMLVQYLSREKELTDLVEEVKLCVQTVRNILVATLEKACQLSRKVGLETDEAWMRATPKMMRQHSHSWLYLAQAYLSILQTHGCR